MNDEAAERVSLILLDLLEGDVDDITVDMARKAREQGAEYDFIIVLAGAPADVDYFELRQLAVDELVRELTGGEDDSDNP